MSSFKFDYFWGSLQKQDCLIIFAKKTNMSKKEFRRILFIKPNDSSFIRGDQKILESFFDVDTILLKQMENKIIYGINNIRLFVLLISKIFQRNLIFVTWFADYHAAVMIFAAMLTGKKSVIFIGGQEAVCYHELKKGVYRNKFRGLLVRFALKNTNIIIANHVSLIYHKNSYYMPENPHIDGIKHYVKNLKTPIDIVYNGIDPQRIIRDYSIAKNDNMILTVGTMHQVGDFYNKGFDLFIQTAIINPQWEFILIGMNKSFKEWLEKQYSISDIRNLKIIYSYCPMELLNQYYNQAKVFVQASITEGMPNTLSEAMLMECIPVGSCVNGIPDAIGDTGIIIKERSVKELQNAIEKALKLNTGKNARERVVNLFSVSVRKEKLGKLFFKLFQA